MTAIHRLSVTLTSEQITALNAAVATGEYATTNEIVVEAIRDWQINHENRSRDVKRLRQLWDEGKTSGPSEPFDIKSIISDAERRFGNAGIE